MNLKGQFVTHVDLGDIGTHDACVTFEGYRPTVQAVDDYSVMEIMSVTIDLVGNLIDISSVITDAAMDALKEEAWEQFPQPESSPAVDYMAWHERNIEQRCGV